MNPAVMFAVPALWSGRQRVGEEALAAGARVRFFVLFFVPVASSPSTLVSAMRVSERRVLGALDELDASASIGMSVSNNGESCDGKFDSLVFVSILT
jgi:hypothetical protein